ncbi:hypothetical protein EYC84_004062 [Monilinia fructicola]|uniref:Uncharacterized protein n=1 Tax=Monilinia fructicola TaxID=38448 RepID=A0A5M9K7K2_MONFR|nr:hypothetical protein EYC84_004062 [Monilinia fructicola]
MESDIEASPLRLELSNDLTSVPGIVTNYVYLYGRKYAVVSMEATGRSDNTESQRRLKLCIRWLSILGKSWKSAGARQQLLIDSMPRDMNMTTLANAAAAVDAQESTTPQPLPEQVSTKAQNSTVDATSSVAKSVATAAAAATEDWEFLREFGDSSDEFYALDGDLLALLENDQWKL